MPYMVRSPGAVSAAVREVWVKAPLDPSRWRCDDPEGCTSPIVLMRWNESLNAVECYCKEHLP